MGRRTRSMSKNDDDEHHLVKTLRTSTCATLLALLLLLLAATTKPTRASVEIRTLAVNSPVAYAGSSAYYLKRYDVCGVCDGDTTTCQGCDRVPNSPLIFDACGSCESPLGGSSGTFNKTCNDCSGNQNNPGEVYGHKVLDDCGNCRDPTDPLFSRTGLPDYHLGGCVGCDGVPFSGNELDSCGVCGGLGCSNSEPLLRSWCCDCEGVPFGPHIINFCCQCVHREDHWLALSDGMFNGPPENHSVALDLWTRGRERVVNGSLELNKFRAALELSSAGGDLSLYERSNSVYRPFREAREYFKRGWEAINDPGSDDNSTCYREVYLEGNTTNPRDICGVCGGDNSTCLGCNPSNPDLGGDPIPDDGLLSDDCDVCGGANADIDHCRMCFGGNRTCNGCDGLPNSGKVNDGCLGSRDIRVLTFEGAIGEVGSGCSDPAEFKASCDAGGGGCCGCDGIPNSPKRLDGCNACLDQTNENNTRLINATCNGCDGVAFSGVAYDACCVCGGDSNFTSQCYLDLLTEGENATAPFDPYTMDYSSYFTEEGRLLIDECGECRSWRYDGSTCLGCDGVHGSGLVEDGCGVCGGDCSSCVANETGLPYNCSGPGLGWTGMDQTCEFVRTEGPSQAWVNWSAFPNGTDGEGKKTVNETWYERLNRPGVPDFTDAARGECRMFLEPPPPLGPRETREWVVKAYGKEEGPYTLDELETGTITVIDITTDESEVVPLLPTTLVARVTTYYQQQTITYGATSMYQDRVESWQQRAGDKVLRSPLVPGVDNAVVVEGLATELWHGGQFMPMSVMPGMERIIYPYCSGSTWRGGKHRLHGKKLPGNYLGIITTENITNVEGLTDQAWNPLDEYIYDVSVGWMDQKCTCSADWQYDSAPIAPTCPKVWFPWSGWVEDGWYVSHNTFVNDTDRYSVAQRRSWTGGGWRVSGGWWAQDYGGGGPEQFGSVGTSLHNAYGGPEDFGFGAVRGPVRLDATGFLSVTTVAPSGGDRIEGGVGAGGRDRCYSAARVSQPRRNTSGAVWSNQRQDVAGGWTTSFDFVVAEPAERCTDVHAVSRSFSEAVHTRTRRTCAAAGGDGFAFVIRDDTDEAPGVGDVGEPGPGIGYQGLRHSLAVEFDTLHNPLNDEPYERHVAVHTNGGDPNDAHHAARLGSTADVPDFVDGGTHRAVITYAAAAGWEAVAAALESGAYRGATPRLSHFTTQNTGLLTVYVDDLETPLLTVPLTVDTVLRAGGRTAWVGFTSGTGETWQIVDLVSWNFTSA